MKMSNIVLNILEIWIFIFYFFSSCKSVDATNTFLRLVLSVAGGLEFLKKHECSMSNTQPTVTLAEYVTIEYRKE